METEYLTLQEVADLLRCRIETVRRLAHSGELPAVKVDRKSYRVGRQALDAWLASRTTGGAR